MCGIRAFIGKKNHSCVHAVDDSLVHRGPDQFFHWCNEKTYVNFFRLAVTGGSAGDAPVTSADLRWTCFMNGEIYNFRSLSLESLGVQFRSDTQVIVEGVAKFGINFLQKIRGMFAAILIDNSSNHIYVFRDFFGEKPLYYAYSETGIHIASEFRTVFSALGSTLKVDSQAILDYFRFGYVEEPTTFDERVKAFPKGMLTCYKDQDGFFEPVMELNNNDDSDISLRELIVKVSSEILCSDVPQGFLLSGGIDSTTLLSLSRDRKAIGDEAFTLKGSGKSNTKDLEGAKKAASRLGVLHNTIEINQANALAELPNLVFALDQPISDMSSLGYFLLFQSIAGRGFKVAQVGHGVDEFFWGYEWFNEIVTSITDNRSRIYWETPSNQIQLLDQEWVNQHQGKALNLHTFDPYLSSGNKFQKARAEICHSYLSHNGLSQMDRLAMFHGVEPRAPFSDARIYHWAQKNSNDSKKFEKDDFYRAFKTNWISRFVPRKKRGFDIGMLEFVNSNEFHIKYLQKLDHLYQMGMPLGARKANQILGARQKYRLVILQLWLQSL